VAVIRRGCRGPTGGGEVSDRGLGAGPSDVDRRRAMAVGSAGIVSLILPSATAAATGGGTVAPAVVGTLTFSEVGTDRFTVSWGGGS
jgi:hypothetical protein